MANFTKLALIVSFGIISVSSISSADILKGQKVYVKKMRAVCGISGGRFAAKHTQDEWENLYKSGAIKEEISKICHGFKLQKNLIPHVYDFVKKYASDSGNVPEC
jgi:hypothetical protein